MSTPEKKSDYIMFFRGKFWENDLSPEEIQAVTNKFMAWFERLTKEGKVKGGSPLEEEGKVITGKKGRNVADGPFAESKEAVGGYFLLMASDMDEAVRIAQECPSLDYGAIVEVRPVAEVCVAKRRSEEFSEAKTLSHAAAA